MYLLYLDGSGSVKNPNDQHFVLAGVGVYERQIYHLITKADDFIASLGYGSVHDVELHASAIASGKTAPWKGTPRQERLGLIERSLSLLRDAHHSVRRSPSLWTSRRTPVTRWSTRSRKMALSSGSIARAA